MTFSTQTTIGGATVNKTITTASVGAANSITTVQGLADKLNADTAFAADLSASVDSNNKLVVTAKSGGSVVGGNTAGTNATAGTGTSVSAAAASTTGLDFSSTTTAQASIGRIDTQISATSTARAKLGALQNRFEHTINNLNVSVENLTASESRIRDTDMAQEMTNFTRTQILTQAGTAMLAQANQAPQGILKLLG
jgi:flagellin